jgi:hypothetical protein
MPKEMAKSLPDNQAPIIPPTAMLASNQKIQSASLMKGEVCAHHFLVMSVPIGSALLASNRPTAFWLTPQHGVIERVHCG